MKISKFENMLFELLSGFVLRFNNEDPADLGQRIVILALSDEVMCLLEVLVLEPLECSGTLFAVSLTYRWSGLGNLSSFFRRFFRRCSFNGAIDDPRNGLEDVGPLLVRESIPCRKFDELLDLFLEGENIDVLWLQILGLLRRSQGLEEFARLHIRVSLSEVAGELVGGRH